MNRSKHFASRSLWICALTLLACALVVPVAAQEDFAHVANMPGFKAALPYQNLGNNESVNLANGGLIVSQPSAI